jgi:hypothetical protein
MCGFGVFSRPHSASEICIKKAQFHQGRDDDAYILIFEWQVPVSTPATKARYGEREHSDV